jgi:peptidoglycan/xylan/chitin deacetylase (PgdA/CDA1 family)
MKRILLVLLLFTDVSLVSGQEIALTFDDAPSAHNEYQSGLVRTRMLLNRLKQADVSQVAFFVVTSRVDSVGKLRLNRYAQAGHIIANHTHSHARISRIGVDTYIQDIFKADAIIRGLPGFQPWLRFPFLDEGRTRENRDRIREALVENGYFNGYVTVDNYDWYLDSAFRRAVAAKKTIDFDNLKSIYLDHLWRSIQFYDTIARATLGRSPKHVLLLHENDLAALFVEDLVRFIREKDWKIISPLEAYQDPIATTIPDVLLNNQGRVAAIARAKGYPGPLSMESESTQFLDRLFEEHRVFQDP